jgi:5'-nucleotidase (lipoprotein e(P4) family)
MNLPRSWFANAVGLLLGLSSSWSAAQEELISSSEKPTSEAATETPERPPYRGLDANLYMQLSAEYRACCYQAYALAKHALSEKIKARLKQSSPPMTRDGDSTEKLNPPAVVLDLDETVFDNRAFQTKQIQEGWAYNQDQWSKFEETGGDDVLAIPGAVEFVQHLKAMGIQPVYITNRNERAQAKTLATLERLKIGVPNDCLLCANAETKSNKDSRRANVRERFDILLLLGDNLRDFDDLFRYDGANGVEAGIEARLKSVDDRQHRFGRDWIIFPNPAYGEWNKVFGQGPDDAKLLRSR